MAELSIVRGGWAEWRARLTRFTRRELVSSKPLPAQEKRGEDVFERDTRLLQGRIVAGEGGWQKVVTGTTTMLTGVGDLTVRFGNGALDTYTGIIRIARQGGEYSCGVEVPVVDDDTSPAVYSVRSTRAEKFFHALEPFVDAYGQPPTQ